MRGLGQDFDFPPLTEETSTSYSSVSYESAPPLLPSAEPAAIASASKTDVKGLQTAINRFFGVTIGAPIAVDGVVGAQTLAAVNSIISWMPGAGYDTSSIATLIGDYPSAGSIALKAAELANVIDWIADDNSFTQDPTGGYPPSVPVATSTRGLRVPAISPAQLPTGRSLRAASFLGLGLPNWTFYAAGGALAILIVTAIIRRKRTKPARR